MPLIIYPMTLKPLIPIIDKSNSINILKVILEIGVLTYKDEYPRYKQSSFLIPFFSSTLKIKFSERVSSSVLHYHKATQSQLLKLLK
ncbi:hypothetical protein CHRY9393_02676 [Chryseobacterium fistulae]|uniref:Uncharacterized protein n=1 Tax=Chryseobacterium fistulae TaxID=2675058 RepID=A0A6N4XYR6_9FLAO|nr:hypothetical protein CHRY9393_02676 [Chryseobacterium fistulae]